MSYTLVAIAFHAAVVGAPTPQIDRVGTFESYPACSAAARQLVSSIEPLTTAPVVFRCLQTDRPQFCERYPYLVACTGETAPIIANPGAAVAPQP